MVTRASSAVMMIFLFIVLFDIVWFLFQQFVNNTGGWWDILLYNITLLV